MISYVLHRNRLQNSAGYTNEQKKQSFPNDRKLCINSLIQVCYL